MTEQAQPETSSLEPNSGPNSGRNLETSLLRNGQAIHSCPDKETLNALLTSTWPADSDLADHLEKCRHCQQALDKLSDSDGLNDYRAIVRKRAQALPALGSPIRAGDLGSLDGMAIESVIGRGGMGIVFQGRDDRLNRRIAVKLLLPGSSAESESRFLREARAAASLQHENIVPVFSSGVSELGSPWMTMPLIVGQSLRQRLNSTRPGLQESARIVSQIARGLHAAHQAGMVHRDVKPGNILLDDHDGRAKLTDFGLVRTNTDETLTQANVICGTPEYMSPEQIDRPDQQESCSDIYSLGIVLYEMLCGTVPFRGRPLDIIEQHRLGDVIPPSRLNRDVPRDLEVVCLKAISRDVANRYANAWEFADDLDAWSRGEPVRARPPNWHQRLRRFVYRYRGLTISVTTIAMVLIAGIAGTTWYAVAANQATQNADAAARSASQSAEQAQKRLDAVVESFSAANPERGARPGLSAVEFLKESHQRIVASLVDDSQGQITMLNSLGVSFLGLGETELARQVFSESLDLALATHSPSHPDPIAIRNNLAVAFRQLDRYDEALKIIDENLHWLETEKGLESAEFLESSDIRLSVLSVNGEFNDAIATGELALPVARLHLGQTHKTTRSIMNSLAVAMQQAGQYRKAQILLEELRQISQMVDPPGEFVKLAAGENLGINYTYLGDYKSAEAILQEVVTHHQTALGPRHPATLRSIDSLAVAASGLGNHEQALQWLLESLAIREELHGPDGSDLMANLTTLGNTCYQLGKIPEANQYLERSLKLKQKHLGEAAPGTLLTMCNLIVVLNANQEQAKAMELALRANQLATENLGGVHDTTLMIRNNLANLLESAGQRNKGIALLQETLAAQREQLGDRHEDTLLSLGNLAAMFRDAGRFDEAFGYYSELAQAHTESGGPENSQALVAQADQAYVKLLGGEFDEAVRIHQKVLETRTSVLGPNHQWTLLSLNQLCVALLQDEQFEAAQRTALRWKEQLELQTDRDLSQLASVYLCLAESSLGLGDPSQAMEWLRKIHECPTLTPWLQVRCRIDEALVAQSAGDDETALRISREAADNLWPLRDTIRKVDLLSVERLVRMGRRFSEQMEDPESLPFWEEFHEKIEQTLHDRLHPQDKPDADESR